MKISQCASAIVLFLCLMHVRSADIILKNNGYENVLVAIGASVPEDPKIIEGIKAIFTDGSGEMYRATRYRAYFRSITILVPPTWKSKPEYKSASNNETCDKAALRIDKQNDEVGDMPYAKPYSTECGKQFRYIHLTPKFVTDVKFATKHYGPLGKVLVHEWAHFRWGVFDEYPHSDGPQFYIEDNDIHPVMCTSNIVGEYHHNVTGGNCRFDWKTRLWEENCRFIPYRNQKMTTASYMFRQWINDIVDFCDDDTLKDPGIKHNAEAPNMQNTMCKRKSVWEVMRQSVDFKKDRNPGNANKHLDTTPSFKLIQRGDTAKVVLLFDVSGSMDGDPMIRMLQVATNFIRNIIRDGSYIGIVTFESVARTELNIMRIRSQADREKAIRYIPKKADGMTAIGLGMQQAMDVLTSYNGGKDWARGASVILMSDGEHNEGIHPEQKIPVATKLGITFHTIGYSDGSDGLLLRKIAQQTGGKHYFSTDNVTSDALFRAFTDTADGQSGECSETSSSPPVMLTSSAKAVIGNNTIQGKFAIDFTIGKDTTITFNYFSRSSLGEIRLEAPDGSVIDKSDTTEYHADRDSQIIQINIPGTAMKGIWKYTIFSSYTTTVLVNVLSKPVGDAGDAQAIRVKSWFGGDNSTLGSGPGAQTSIFAQVSRGYTPVIGLKVTAAIEGRTQEGFKTFHVDLQDKGFGVDLAANDGIYSVVFGRFVVNTEGRYSVSIQVDNPENTGKIAKYTYSKVSGAPPIGTGPDKPVATYETVGPIQRVAGAAELKVERPSFPTPVDVIPPPRIRDLQLVLLDIKTFKVTLKWTAVGDDVSHSRNTANDLRIGTFEEISDRFEHSSRIHLLVPPRNIGEAEQHTIDIADYNKTATYFLAIRAIDEAGNKGDPSNIISFSMSLPTKYSNGDEITTDSPATTKSSPAATKSSKMLIILVCVGVAVVILTAVVVGVVYYCRKKKTLPPKQSGDVIDAEQGGPAPNPPKAVYNAGKDAAVYHVGQEGKAPLSYAAYDNRAFSNVAQIVKQYEALKSDPGT